MSTLSVACPDAPAHESTILFVVPDRFGCFSDNPQVVTPERLKDRLIAHPGLTGGGPPIRLYPGLGVDPAIWARVVELLSEPDLAGRAVIGAEPPTKLPRQEVIKLHDKNVLLGNLVELDSRRFRADLVVSTDTEMILDHTAERQHLPGMLLMEACCQMLIAATRRFFAIHRPGVEYYSVMQDFSIEFNRFAFPLPTTLTMTIDTWEESETDRPRLTCTIEVAQCGAVNSRARWVYRAFRPHDLFPKEAKRARTAILAQATAIQNGM